MRRMLCVLSLILVTLCTLAAEEPLVIPSDLKEFANHLEYLDYTVASAEEDSVRLTHEDNLNIRIKTFQNGLLVSAFLSLSKEGLDNTDDLLTFINTVNKNSAMMKMYLDDDSLVVESWYPGNYNKPAFSTYMTCWIADFQYAVEQNHDAFLKYWE